MGEDIPSEPGGVPTERTLSTEQRKSTGMTGQRSRRGSNCWQRGTRFIKARREILIQDISFSLRCGGGYTIVQESWNRDRLLTNLITADQKKRELTEKHGEG